ncbi:Ldh family oxidoreductase [Actinomadura madurae]|uniref:Ldh family oxidoreductase n=1 Tax=Actinomadura madurae TaxID=1993 RepID=UPI002025C664|nr:Ldh family oxidoreductase [Actinomadura madurae]MCP9968129.1 Ldh family oxidoreductase [Actinomadura madurae]URM96873.1 Ldh family oxidoreductase [Actinomadura madurae]
MKIPLGAARRLAHDLLAGAGLAEERAETTARAITLADAWGIGSHGLFRLPYYLDRMAAGGHPPDAELKTRADTGPLVFLEGGGGLGHWQVAAAAETAVERSGRYGVAAVAVGDSGHCGALGVYALEIARAGRLGLVFSNGPAALPPWGGDRALLSTSPIAAGIPLSPRPAVVDLALSTVARGKVGAKAKAGETLPEGWALDRAGRPTTDPREALAGMLAPLGGAKGYALAFMVEALTGGLVGPHLSRDVADPFAAGDRGRPQRIAHLVLALDPSLGDPEDGGAAARDRLADLADQVAAAGGRVPGTGRSAPGELGDDDEIEVDAAVLDDLRTRAARRGPGGPPAPDGDDREQKGSA